MLSLAFGTTWLFQPGYGDPALQTGSSSWLMTTVSEIQANSAAARGWSRIHW